MVGYDSNLLLPGDGIASGWIPVDPGLAVLVLIGALIVTVVFISLAAVPPSGLLRRLKLTHPSQDSGPAQRRRTARASA
jgi:hypothetical protein